MKLHRIILYGLLSVGIGCYVTLAYNHKVFESTFNKANRTFVKGKYEKAIDQYNQLIQMDERVPQVHFNLAMAWLEQKNNKQAKKHLNKAIELKSDYAKAYYQLGKILENENNKPQAIEAYQKALTYDNNFVEAMIALAHILRDSDNIKEAIYYYKKAVTIQITNVQLLMDLANALNVDNQMEEALAWYFRLLELAPNNPSIIYNIAYTYKKLNQIEKAIPYYHRALQIQPEHAEANFSYGLALLITGNHHPNNWSFGWSGYEWRWKRDGGQTMRQYAQPLWDGSDLHGKVLFLWAEQGLGDTFEFIRYAKVAKDMGARKVIFATQKPLMDYIKELPYIDQVITLDERPSYFDFHAPLLSMPYLTKTTLENIPNEIPYLHIDDELVEEWREILKEDTNFKIGICWQGNADYPTQFLRMTVAAKSMHISQFMPIMNIPGVTVYSLQKMTGTDQVNELPAECPLVIFGNDFDTTKGRFRDTAAVIKNLDLVITIDTSICHFAAGLGIPTWNLLPNPPDWRWLLNCDNSPWFPNMRLFRQPTPGDWNSVIEEVVKELKAHLYNNKPLIVHSRPYNTQ